MSPVLAGGIFTTCGTWETLNGILLSHKKNEILPFATTHGVMQRYYDKWNVREHKTNTLWSHLYVESKNKQKQTNEQTKEKEGRLIATENKLVVAWWVSWGKIGEVV